MNYIDYAIVVRTIGKAGEKYRKLLKSIDNLEQRPKEVIIVLPEGYDIPKEKLGYEKFVFSPKGMISQRLYGLYQTNCTYILFCDDDISFNSNYINMLYEPIKQGIADATVAPLIEFLPEKGIKSFVSILLGSAIPTIFNKQNYITILRSSGWSYNRINLNNSKKYYNTQSAAWTNFFIKRETMLKIRLEDEIWLEKFKYASLDDQTMFYKLYKMNYRTLVVSNAVYVHEDAKTSIKELKLEPIYTSGFNHYVFWHRFIYSFHNDRFNKLLDIICFQYWYIMNLVYNRLKNGKEVANIFNNGVIDAKEYIKSREYNELPGIKI